MDAKVCAQSCATGSPDSVNNVGLEADRPRRHDEVSGPSKEAAAVVSYAAGTLYELRVHVRDLKVCKRDGLAGLELVVGGVAGTSLQGQVFRARADHR